MIFFFVAEQSWVQALTTIQQHSVKIAEKRKEEVKSCATKIKDLKESYSQKVSEQTVVEKSKADCEETISLLQDTLKSLTVKSLTEVVYSFTEQRLEGMQSAF